MNKASMIQDICTKIGCGYLETMYRMTTQQVTWLWMNIYKFEHNTRKEVIEFAKKSFNDDQYYEGHTVKKELDEVLSTYSTDKLKEGENGDKKDLAD